MACGDWHKIVNQIETAKLSGVEKPCGFAEKALQMQLDSKTYPFPGSAGDFHQASRLGCLRHASATVHGSLFRPVRARPVRQLSREKKMARKASAATGQGTALMEQASHAYARAAACSRNLSNQRATQCQTALCVAGSRELQERSDARPGISEIFPLRIALSREHPPRSCNNHPQSNSIQLRWRRPRQDPMAAGCCSARAFSSKTCATSASENYS